MTPVSLFAHITEIKVGLGASFKSTLRCSKSKTPLCDTIIRLASGTASNTASCSILEISILKQLLPLSARMSASVPPLVKITFSCRAPINSET